MNAKLPVQSLGRQATIMHLLTKCSRETLVRKLLTYNSLHLLPLLGMP